MPDILSSIRYEPKFIDPNNKNTSHGLIIDMVGKNKTVLEVGTSTGYVSKIFKENGNRVIGIEIDQDAGETAKQYCEAMIIGDIEIIDLGIYLKDLRFDVIVFGDVLEHLKYPEQVIGKIKKYLKPDGYMVISLPNGCHGDVIFNLLYGDFQYTSMGLHDITHLRFFGWKNILDMFKNQTLRITNLNKVRVPIGYTELKVDMDKVPNDLLNFIRSIPDSDVYQYVFMAIPDGIADNTPRNEQIPAIQLKPLFYTAIEGTIENRVERELHESYDQLHRLENELSDMRQSVVWRMLMAYQRIVDVVLPPTTRRGRAYGLGLKCIRILATKGPGELWLRARNYLKASNNINDSIYEKWIRQNEPSKNELAAITEDSKKFYYRPLISIIMPVWNTDKKWLCKAIDSVINQTYDRWELCIADGGSKKPHVKKILKDYAKKDPRIKIKFLTKNKGISGNTNEALSLATGEYIGLLDHDDELSLNALYEVVKFLQNHLDADMIYSDEDKINVKGKRVDPFFKPDWSPDMFLSYMYTNHFSVYRKKIIDEIGGFREGYDGSQDYDLVLRFIEKTNKIYHIPKILYHWRVTSNSTAMSVDNKKYARESAKRALKEFLSRNNIKGDVEDGLWATSYRIKRAVSEDAALVSIIIPTKDKVDALKRCIESIFSKTDYDNYEIIIVNNRSENESTYAYFKELVLNEKIKIFDYDKEFNFSAINNFAASKANGDFLLFLNNDMEVITSEWIWAMLEHAQRKEVGAVGCKLLYPNNTLQHAGVILGISGNAEKGVAGHSHKYLASTEHGYFGRVDVIQDVSAVTAACMMLRRDVFDEVGGFDEKLQIAFNDVDLCLKMRRKGYLIVYTPYAMLYHYESLSRGYEDTPEKVKRFNDEVTYVRSKWGDLIDSGDPYYNVNLSLKREDFSIKV